VSVSVDNDLEPSEDKNNASETSETTERLSGRSH
jgi:hypothetical protein